MAQRNQPRDEREVSGEYTATPSETAARAFGVVFILIGLVLIVLLVGGFITSRLPYRVDPTLPIPTLDKVKEYTNDETAEVTGTALPGEKVVLYINDERTNTTVETDEDGAFTFSDIALEEEGEVSFASSVVRGGLFKRRSELSNTITSVVDWTSPSSTVSLDYQETANTNKVTIKGTAEPNAIVVLNSGEKTYEATVDDKGIFTFDEVILEQGDNTFSVTIKDLAGNEVRASKKVQIAYAGGEINGNGASTVNGATRLPESAGELEAAMEFLAGNKLMSAMALIILAAFGASASTAYMHAKRNSR